MKRLIILFSLFVMSAPVTAQVFGVNYAWTDSVATTTTARDSTFDTAWEQVSIWADVEIQFKFSGSLSDTSSWASRDWLKLLAGQVLSVGPATKMKRFEWKASSGTGTTYFLGYKKNPRF